MITVGDIVSIQNQRGNHLLIIYGMLLVL